MSNRLFLWFSSKLYGKNIFKLAAQLFEITWTVRLHAIDRHIALSEIPSEIIEEHVAVLAAIKERNVTLAQERLLEHHNNTVTSFRAQIEQHDT